MASGNGGYSLSTNRINYESHLPSPTTPVLRLHLDRPRLARNRAVKACEQCRSRKIKCDQSRPYCRCCSTNNRRCIYQQNVTSQTGQVTTIKHRFAEAKLRKDLYPQPNVERDVGQTIQFNQVGHLTATGRVRLRYYSSSSWVAGVKESDVSFIDHYDINCLNSQDVQLWSPLLRTEPLKDFIYFAELDPLITWYTKYCHFWFPLVDIAEIVMLTRNLRNRQNSSYDTLALIAAICYTAARSVSISGDLESLGSVSIYFWRDIACQLLERSGYPSRSNLNNLRVAFFLAMPSMAEGISHPDPRSISTLVRVAQSLGLHRDPSSFNLSGHDADLSRIIWWSVRGLDTSYAIAHALPPLIHPTSTDVQNPYYDDGIECKLLRTVIRTGILISRALHKVYGVSQPTLHEIQQLDEEAEKIYAEEISGSHHPNMTSMERFVAISRMMCCCKMIFILHQPYLRTRQWPQNARLKILKACEDYINGFVTGFKDETLAPYRWVLSHFDVIHACAIVLQDLIQHSHSPESSALRKVVEVCFSTFSRDHHVDWSRLKVLRSKAWAANQWLENGRRISIGSLETDFSLADWNALFASFTWKDLEI